MAASYEVHLRNTALARVAIITDFLELTYARKLNAVGILEMRVPAEYFDLIQEGSTLEVWRGLTGVSSLFNLEGDTFWIVDYISQDELGTVTVRAKDLMVLLERRCVLYPAGNANSKVTAQACDNALKSIATVNLSSTAAAVTTTPDVIARGITGLTVAGNLSAAPVITKAFAYRNVMVVMQEIADYSASQGTRLYFDIVAVSTGTYQFRTYTGQRGNDHRYLLGSTALLLAPDLGNMSETNYTLDYSDETNYIYVAGQGEEASRASAVAYSLAAVRASPFALKEDFRDARNSSDPNALTGEAGAEIRASRAKEVLTGKLLETDNTRYGLHYGFGDLATAIFRDKRFDVMVYAVGVKLADNQENITSQLRSL